MKKICIFCSLLFLLFSFASCGILNESDVHHSDAFIASSEGVSVTTEYDNEKTSAVQSSSCTYSSTVMDKTNSENVSVTTEHIEENTSTNQTLPYDANDDSSINTDNLCATIVCNYPYSQKEYSYYILCVSLNGDVWGTTYSLNADGSDVNKFFYKLYSCDESVWTLTSKTNYLGKLELNDIEILTESIADINLKSEYYSRENDITPDVEDSVYYTIYCYVTAENGEKSSFHVKSYGDNTGRSYETMDINAISIFQMIQNSKPYETWLENHMH